MPAFRYRAYGTGGDVAEGTIDAASQNAASDLLWGQGLIAFQMRQADAAAKKWWRRDVFVRRAPTTTDLALFTRDFATLNSAELPLDDALRILAEQTAAKMRKLAGGLLGEVLNGGTLSDAMQKQGPIFSADYVSAVRAGEIGGTLAQVLEELADLLERRAE